MPIRTLPASSLEKFKNFKAPTPSSKTGVENLTDRQVQNRIAKAKTKMPRKRVQSTWCEDEDGDKFQSITEMQVIADLKLLQKAGYISNLRLQVPFRFDVINLERTYISDATFDCLKECSVASTSKKPLVFYPGKHYVVDAKSPYTRKFEMFRMKKDLMKAVHGIEVIEIVRGKQRKKKSKKKC